MQFDTTDRTVGKCTNSPCILHHLSFAVKAEDLKADAWRASSLNLMQMPEEVESRSSPAIVEFALSQNAQQSRLARVHVPQDGNSQVEKLKENTHAHTHTHREGTEWINNELMYNSSLEDKKKHLVLTRILLTCWSSGTLRMRTSAIFSGTSAS